MLLELIPDILARSNNFVDQEVNAVVGYYKII